VARQHLVIVEPAPDLVLLEAVTDAANDFLVLTGVTQVHLVLIFVRPSIHDVLRQWPRSHHWMMEQLEPQCSYAARGVLQVSGNGK
jgi:hypothetical protein